MKKTTLQRSLLARFVTVALSILTMLSFVSVVAYASDSPFTPADVDYAHNYQHGLIPDEGARIYISVDGRQVYTDLYADSKSRVQDTGSRILSVLPNAYGVNNNSTTYYYGDVCDNNGYGWYIDYYDSSLTTYVMHITTGSIGHHGLTPPNNARVHIYVDGSQVYTNLYADSRGRVQDTMSRISSALPNAREINSTGTLYYYNQVCDDNGYWWYIDYYDSNKSEYIMYITTGNTGNNGLIPPNNARVHIYVDGRQEYTNLYADSKGRVQDTGYRILSVLPNAWGVSNNNTTYYYGDVCDKNGYEWYIGYYDNNQTIYAMYITTGNTGSNGLIPPNNARVYIYVDGRQEYTNLYADSKGRVQDTGYRILSVLPNAWGVSNNNTTYYYGNVCDNNGYDWYIDYYDSNRTIYAMYITTGNTGNNGLIPPNNARVHIYVNGYQQYTNLYADSRGRVQDTGSRILSILPNAHGVNNNNTTYYYGDVCDNNGYDWYIDYYDSNRTVYALYITTNNSGYEETVQSVTVINNTKSGIIEILFGNAKVNFPDQQPIFKDGRTMIPIRALSESMGFKVDWNQQLQQVTVSNGKRTVTLTIGSSVYTVDGIANILDVPPFALNGRTMVPIRFIAEALGCTVDYVVI